MVVEGKGYKMEKLTDASFYNLSILTKVNADTDKEREEYKIVGYGMTFPDCLQRIVDFRLNQMDGIYSLKEFIDIYEEIVNEIGKDFI